MRGLKLCSGITASHVHAADHAKQWLAGRHADLPVEQQGFALSEQWSLRSGPCTQHGQRCAACVFFGARSRKAVVAIILGLCLLSLPNVVTLHQHTHA